MSTVATQQPPAAAPAAAAHVAVIDRHLRGLWRYLRMHGAGAAEADDLAQEAFVVALQKGALQREPAITAAFLRTTARHLFLRARKGGTKQAQLADTVDELWAIDCAGDDGESLVAAVRACVGELQGRARTAVEMSYGLGEHDAHSRAAVARELGLQENGVKTLLQRVRQKLRECVERRKQR